MLLVRNRMALQKTLLCGLRGGERIKVVVLQGIGYSACATGRVRDLQEIHEEHRLTVTGRAVPIVDEVAALPLDLWAVDQGYHKIEMNLVGI